MCAVSVLCARRGPIHRLSGGIGARRTRMAPFTGSLPAPAHPPLLGVCQTRGRSLTLTARSGPRASRSHSRGGVRFDRPGNALVPRHAVQLGKLRWQRPCTRPGRARRCRCPGVRRVDPWGHPPMGAARRQGFRECDVCHTLRLAWSDGVLIFKVDLRPGQSAHENGCRFVLARGSGASWSSVWRSGAGFGGAERARAHARDTRGCQ